MRQIFFFPASGEDGDNARGQRALRVLEQNPDGALEGVGRQRLGGGVDQTFVHSELVDHVGTELVERKLVGKDFDVHVDRTPKVASTLQAQ